MHQVESSLWQLIVNDVVLTDLQIGRFDHIQEPGVNISCYSSAAGLTLSLSHRAMDPPPPPANLEASPTVVDAQFGEMADRSWVPDSLHLCKSLLCMPPCVDEGVGRSICHWRGP